MKAAFIKETGSPDVIQIGDLPKPEPGPGQILVRNRVVGLNPVDTYIRNGANYWELPQPFIVGCDAAGEVEAVGEPLGDAPPMFAVGDRVWTTNQGLVGRQGVWAEYSAIDEEWAYPTPDDVSDETAAAGALVGVTAHLGLFRQARLKADDKVFVNGGSGGVGSTVVQMAKAAGAEVITTAGSDEKVAACLELGADVAVNYKTADIAAAVNEFAPEGVDVYWETVREPNFETIVSYMAERGRIILMAGRDARPEFPVGPFYVKELSLLGVVMFKASPHELRICAEDMNRWYSAGTLKPNISTRLTLDDAAAAHQLQEENTLHQANTLAGKIVLKV